MKTKTLKAYLGILVAFSLALSSCDKKNACLVNRRTATPERIEEIRKNDVLAMFPASLHPLILDALARLPADRQHFITNLDIDLCQRLNVALDTLNNDADRINFIYNFFYFHPNQRQNLFTAFNRFDLDPDFRRLFIDVLAMTDSVVNRQFIANIIAHLNQNIFDNLIAAVNTLDTKATRMALFYHFVHFPPNQRQNLLDAFNRFVFTPSLRSIFIYVLITTNSVADLAFIATAIANLDNGIFNNLTNAINALNDPNDCVKLIDHFVHFPPNQRQNLLDAFNRFALDSDLRPIFIDILTKTPSVNLRPSIANFITTLDDNIFNRFTIAVNTLDTKSTRMALFYHFVHFPPHKRQNLFTAFNRFDLDPDFRRLFIYVLITTDSERQHFITDVIANLDDGIFNNLITAINNILNAKDRRHFVKYFATLPADRLRPRLINIINDLATLPNDRCHALITALDIANKFGVLTNLINTLDPADLPNNPQTRSQTRQNLLDTYINLHAPAANAAGT